MLSLPERAGRHVLNAVGYRSRRVETGAGRLHVLDKRGGGRLPTTVLLHGLSANAVNFAGMMRRLAPHVERLVAPDMPGHGLSPPLPDGSGPGALTDALFEGLDRLIDRPVMLVGTSMGGFCAARYAASRPQRVAKLVLVAPGGAAMEEGELQAFLDTFRIDDRAHALRFVDALFATPPRWIRQPLALGVRRRFADRGMRAMVDGMSSAHLLRAPELHALTMPVLLVWGRQERILPRRHLDFYRDNLPGHAIVEHWDGFGHIGFLERPDALAERILRFAAAGSGA